MEILNSLYLGANNRGVSTGVHWLSAKGRKLASHSPVDGKLIAEVETIDQVTYNKVVTTSQKAFLQWRLWPAPRRGEIVRQIGDSLRENKPALGRLVSYEMGKSLQEGLGEVQEM